ncbi:MAG TPA: branched-chain amino acid ABC transporter permease [Hyphomicrobiaceae bacterium]|nr:branched-chain amino acid ABC transporter permease [Hyphomicrobiaceae bacterium]
MIIDPGLFLNAVVSGLLLGGFYIAVALGLSIAFGQLDIVNIAHPAFVIVGSYFAYYLGAHYGFDPVLTGILLTPVFFVAGILVYRVYYVSFERTGQESLSGLAFFFGLMFIIEVTLIMIYGVDYRLVPAPYIGMNWKLGLVDFPLRMAIPFVVSMVMTIGIYFYLSKTFIGRAILAVSQDRQALQLMGADPVRIKQIAFGLAIATASVAGALLIIIGPVEPSINREYIGRAFAMVVLGGMGSITGTVIAGFILGIAESFVQTFAGPSWAPAVSFSILLLTLAVRPSGILGRQS